MNLNELGKGHYFKNCITIQAKVAETVMLVRSKVVMNSYIFYDGLRNVSFLDPCCILTCSHITS